MAVKTNTYQVELEIVDTERNYYRTHNLTLSRPQSETEEKTMVLLVAFACQAADGLVFGDSPEEPTMLTRDGAAIDHWLEVGEPDVKRLLAACSKAKQVIVYAYASSAPGWWNQTSAKADKENLSIYHILGVPTSGLGKLLQRETKLHCMIQDGQIWVTADDVTVQLDIDTLKLSAEFR